MPQPPTVPAHCGARLQLGLPAVLTVLLACPAAPEPSPREAATERKDSAAAPDGDTNTDTDTAGPQFVAAADSGDIAELVATELKRADADDRQLLVYVGASWCEPCRYFHAAVEDGSLDAVWPRLRLVEFDLDRDRDRLAAAGYSSTMIPLFAVPGPDGRASGRQIQGSIKGPGAVDQLRPRIDGLLRMASADARSRAR